MTDRREFVRFMLTGKVTGNSGEGVVYMKYLLVLLKVSRDYKNSKLYMDFPAFKYVGRGLRNVFFNFT